MHPKYLVFAALGMCAIAFGQTPWPAVQSENYPTLQDMKPVRHEQSILLGESSQQPGLFFAQLSQAYSERVQTQLIEDARRKGWELQSAMRFGTQYVLSFTKGVRLLDIRLTNTAQGVDAVYSVLLNQQAAMPTSATPTNAARPVAPVAPAQSPASAAQTVTPATR